VDSKCNKEVTECTSTKMCNTTKRSEPRVK
jgi:hypothetical protein